MKKLVGISLFIFWAAVTAILTAGLIFYQNNKLPAGSPTPTSTASGSVTNIATATLNLLEIAKHNSANDCWLLISNKVYNVTSYLGVHPGGAYTIIPSCGRDATQDYATKDIGRPHSSFAGSLLTNYYIGDLNQTLSPLQIQQNVQGTKSAAPPPNSGGREYEDD